MKSWKDIQSGESDDVSPQPEPEVQDEVMEVDETSTALVPIAKLLPDVASTVTV